MYKNYECKYSREENLMTHQGLMETISNTTWGMKQVCSEFTLCQTSVQKLSFLNSTMASSIL